MAGKYGCPWTNIMCFQGCGCCNFCNENKRNHCNSVCGIYRDNKNKPELNAKSETEFPVLGSKPKEYIPLDIIKPHEKQAIINHSQTLQRLAERGGLSWNEILFVLEDEQFDYKTQISEMTARTKVLQFINDNITFY